MSEFEQLYREVILDHYKAPRNHGLLEPSDAVAEGRTRSAATRSPSRCASARAT